MTDLFGDSPEHELEYEEEPASRRQRRTSGQGGNGRGDSRSAREVARRRRRSIFSFVVMIAILGGIGFFAVKIIVPSVTPDPQATPMVTDYPGPGHDEVTVDIPEGANGAQIGDILTTAGVVATTDAFSAAFAANSAATSIQPGSYSLALEMKASDAVSALLDPNRRVDSRITIPEGWRADQIYARIADNLGIPVEDVTTAAHDYASFGLDGPPNTNDGVLDPMEGWFYPSTYSVPPGSTAADVLKQMYDRTISELDKLGVAPEDRLRVLTIGSIAIKEAFFEEDWPKVTRVIENRLVPGNATGATTLGMDSTLDYAWSVQNPGQTMDPSLHNSDTSPYNTRKNSGLPPSPIGSIDSRLMEAAVYPEEGDWVFFVSTDLCSGVTTFTDDYNEFLQLQEQFRAWNEKYVANGSTCPVPEG